MNELIREIIRKNPNKQYFMVLDTETCTIRNADVLAETGVSKDLDEEIRREIIAKRKQKIAIAKPIVYDIGWVIVDRKGELYKKVNFLVAEVFYDRQLFATGYYANKLPIYMEAITNGEITVKPWSIISEELKADMEQVDYVCAYNATFDYKKAVPYTDLYLSKYYSNTVEDKRVFARWEWGQEQTCKRILNGAKKEESNPDFLNPVFAFGGIEKPIIDLWGLACDKLINIDKYRKFCLDRNLLTVSKEYFKTSAETSFQYLEKQYDFIESHTALSDSLIEARILARALAKGKAEAYLVAFPFQKLGTTYDFVSTKDKKHLPTLIAEVETYVETLSDGAYKTKVTNKLARLYSAKG